MCSASTVFLSLWTAATKVQTTGFNPKRTNCKVEVNGQMDSSHQDRE
jgi:hypothetical protein